MFLRSKMTSMTHGYTGIIQLLDLLTSYRLAITDSRIRSLRPVKTWRFFDICMCVCALGLVGQVT